MMTASISSGLEKLAPSNCSAARQQRSPAVVDCAATYLWSSPINPFNLARFFESVPYKAEFSTTVFRSDPTTLATPAILPWWKIITFRYLRIRLLTFSIAEVNPHAFLLLLRRLQNITYAGPTPSSN